MNDCHLPAEGRNRVKKDVALGRGASYGNAVFFVSKPRSSASVRTVHFQGFREGDAQRFQKFLARALLAIHPGDFFNPTNPPPTVLFDDSRICLIHVDTSEYKFTPAALWAIERPNIPRNRPA